MGWFSVSGCANQSPRFSISETLTPNGLFQYLDKIFVLKKYFLKKILGYD